MLIWLPEQMDPPAANKLLKVLEEPEPRTVFLLVGHSAEQLLPTILSRVQLVKVPALTEEDIMEELHARFPELQPDELRPIAIRADGDLLEAVAMADKSEEELFVLFRDWLRACYSNKVPDMVEFSEHFQKMGRERQKSLMRYALYLIRQCVLQWQQVPQLVNAVGEERDFVHALPVLPDGRIALVRQYRHAAQVFCLELPGGLLDPHETPLAGAQREAREECGLTGGEWSELATFYPNPARQTNRFHCFLARNVEKTLAASLDANEEIELYFLTIAEVDAAIADGSFSQSGHIASFLMAKSLLQNNKK